MPFLVPEWYECVMGIYVIIWYVNTCFAVSKWIMQRTELRIGTHCCFHCSIHNDCSLKAFIFPYVAFGFGFLSIAINAAVSCITNSHKWQRKWCNTKALIFYGNKIFAISVHQSFCSISHWKEQTQKKTLHLCEKRKEICKKKIKMDEFTMFPWLVWAWLLLSSSLFSFCWFLCFKLDIFWPRK